MKNDYHINTMYFFPFISCQAQWFRKKTRKNHERYFHGYCDFISVYQYVFSVLIDIEHDSYIFVTYKWITRPLLDDLSNWSYKWLSKTWEVIWTIRSCEQISFIYILYIYIYWETQRALSRWWWISERSRINFERSSMIENVAWRWFEDNVFENLICWFVYLY